MYKKLLSITALALVLVAGIASPQVGATREHNPPVVAKVNWCHATESEKNPYEAIQVSGNAGGHATHEGDFLYAGPLDDGKPDKEDGDEWCEDNAPKPEDVCSNIEGIQTKVPEGYTEVNGVCTLTTGGQGGGTTTATTTAVATPQVAAPVSGVNAGAGTGSAIAPLVAMTASAGTLGYGILRLRKFNV